MVMATSFKSYTSHATKNWLVDLNKSDAFVDVDDGWNQNQNIHVHPYANRMVYATSMQ
jgi:hypothetical protein